MLPGPCSRSTSAPVTRATRPIASPRLAPTRCRRSVVVVMEDLLDGRAEVAGDREREGQGRVVTSRLDRVDRLAGHSQRVGEGGLGQTVLLAQPADLVPHVAPLCQARLS